MLTLVDQQRDPGQRITFKLSTIVDMPEFVKQATVFSSDEVVGVRDQFFAWPSKRMFPCHTKCAAFVSRLFYEMQRTGLTPDLQKTLDTNFEKMATWWDIKDDLVEALPTVRSYIRSVAATAASAGVAEKSAAEKSASSTLGDVLEDYIVKMTTGDHYFVHDLVKAGMQPFMAVDSDLADEVSDDDDGFEVDPSKVSEVIPTLPIPAAKRLRSALKSAGITSVDPKSLTQKSAEMTKQDWEQIAKRAGATKMAPSFSSHFSRAADSRYSPVFMTQNRIGQ